MLTLIVRDLYKTRLEVFFKHYSSKNFDGRSWGELFEVILVRRLPYTFVSTQTLILIGRRSSKPTLQWHMASLSCMNCM
jgi:hypothetical protein